MENPHVYFQVFVLYQYVCKKSIGTVVGEYMVWKRAVFLREEDFQERQRKNLRILIYMANRYEESISYTVFCCKMLIERDHRLATWAKSSTTFCCDLNLIPEKRKLSAFYS